MCLDLWAKDMTFKSQGEDQYLRGKDLCLQGKVLCLRGKAPCLRGEDYSLCGKSWVQQPQHTSLPKFLR